MIVVEPSDPQDLPGILRISQNADVFTEEEVSTVDELFQGYLNSPQKSGYYYLSCRVDGLLAGFACWGPTALSKATADFYWLCTDRVFQGRGVAQALFKEVEKRVLEVGLWQIIIWTSGKENYAPARCLYQKMGCELVVKIPEFYDHGDDLCVYLKRLTH